MLNVSEFRRALEILSRELAGSRVQRCLQPDDWRLVVAFYGPSGIVNLVISCRQEFARISTAERVPEASAAPSSFVQYLRAHLSRARFRAIEISPGDRQGVIVLTGEEGDYRLIISLRGARSNIYLLDADSKLVHALRPLDLTSRDLRFGDPWSDEQGGPRPQGEDRWRDVADPDYLRAIDDTYRGIEQVREAESLARRLDSALTKEESFLARKAANLLEDLGESRQAERYRHTGELLKNALHTLRKGDQFVTVTDFESGEQVVIPVDPKLSPAENLQSYFARYQKESRGEAIIQQQIDELSAVQREIAELHGKLRDLTRVPQPDLEALTQLASHPRLRRVVSRFYPARKPHSTVKAQGKRDIPARLQPKRYRSEDGLEIWVGRNDEGNDYLTTRLARGNDLFFHLEGYPGSHVVLRTEGKTDPPPRAVLDACELAVHFSKMKESSRADVHVAAVKDVKKPKGARPGLVYVLKGRTVHLRRDIKRLRSILSSRLDE
jgi:predicted ribosome quality control (RQC) complex YloA/Tae2 family protein